jgi:ADP-ribose diphosphatase
VLQWFWLRLNLGYTPIQFFNIQSMDVAFSNGEKRQYERLKPDGDGAVLVVPMLDDDTVLMIYEYSGGTHRYELALTKGKIDAGESPLEAANRELIEEIGYGAKKLSFVKTMTLAPGYQSNFTHIVLAQDLYEDSAQGDEPNTVSSSSIGTTKTAPSPSGFKRSYWRFSPLENATSML